MTKRYSRRDAVLLGAFFSLSIGRNAAASTEKNTWQDLVKVPDRLAREAGVATGSGGFEYPGGAGRAVAYLFFDPQDPKSIRLVRRVRPFVRIVDIVFCPIAAVNAVSRAQADTILFAHPQWRMLDRHLSLFDAPKRRGIREADDTDNDKGQLSVGEVSGVIQANTEAFTRAIDPLSYPFGFMENAGELELLDPDITESELSRLFGVARESFYGPDK